MFDSLALVLLFANTPAGETRKPDVAVERQPAFAGTPTDPLFDKRYVATDDPAFILTAVESSRQAVLDARTATEDLVPQHLRDAAVKIGKQNDATNQKLEALAKSKGWRLPDNNPMRRTTLGVPGAPRTNANFIVNQIAFHEATLAQYRAQIGGKGDAQLRRALREQLPGYEKNLDMLLKLKP
jgi:hypothetical protein